MKKYRFVVILFWVLAFATIPVLWRIQDPPAGWDLRVYSNAAKSLHAGHDPYADGIAAQQVYHEHLARQDPYGMPPYTYVYSPVTLPLVRLVGHLPHRFAKILYWSLYWAGISTMAWICVLLTEPQERTLFELLAPAAMFFPGLIEGNVLLSGNLAFLLYGLILGTAWLGWKSGRWIWFYLAVVAASCFKAPMLTLLVIPLFSARNQWKPACTAAFAGVAIFLAQPVTAPRLFQSYLEAVELQFRYNHDFGLSPAGLLGNTLFFQSRPYSSAMTVSYVLYGGLVAGILLYLAKQYFDGRLTLERWAPVLVLGAILLNPRVKEYDVAPLTLPMTLIGWRILRRHRPAKRAALWMTLAFALVVALTFSMQSDQKPLAGALLVILFFAGVWDLSQEIRAVASGMERNSSFVQQPEHERSRLSGVPRLVPMNYDQSV